jgi:hypothetical protein
MMPDWLDPQAYAYCSGLSAAQWAWEFLRRHPGYRHEWSDFIETWRALEACYGKPAKRDIQAWQQDPRAWVSAAQCQEGDCRLADDKVLIECALGARWGFYKFPPDPLDEDPVGAGRLVWRPVTAAVRLGDESPPCARATAAGEIAVYFDLSLPLPEQLTAAKRRLQITQRKKIRAGQIDAPRIAAQSVRLRRLLRLLDALEAGAEPAQIVQRLFQGVPERYAEEKNDALELREGGYRRLLLLDG